MLLATITVRTQPFNPVKIERRVRARGLIVNGQIVVVGGRRIWASQSC